MYVTISRGLPGRVTSLMDGEREEAVLQSPMAKCRIGSVSTVLCDEKTDAHGRGQVLQPVQVAFVEFLIEDLHLVAIA